MNVIRIKKFLIVITFMALPFNSLPVESPLFGEFGFEGAFYSLLLCILVSLVFLSGKYEIPRNTSFYIITLLVIWILINSILNLDIIQANYFKGRTGTSKLTSQLIVILFGYLSIIFYFNLFRNVKFEFICKAVFISTIIPFIYSFLEILNYLNVGFVTSFLMSIDKYIHVYGYWNYLVGTEVKIRSVSGEASWFGTYLAFIYPWILQNIFKNSKSRSQIKSIMYLLYLYLLTFLTFSRTVYVIILIQSIVFLGLRLLRYRTNKSIFTLIATFIIMLLLSANTISSSVVSVIGSLASSDNLSNVGRFSMQQAALGMWNAHPLMGIGFGQFGFNVPFFVKSEAPLISSEVKEWLLDSSDSPWPPVHSLYPRLLAETGILGLLFWISTWFLLIRRFIKNLYSSKYSDNDFTIYTLVCLLIGVLLIGFNIDSLRLPVYYIALGLCYNFIYKREGNNEGSLNNFIKESNQKE